MLQRTRPNEQRTAAKAREQGTGGFTLIETLVAIGAVALVAVGLAAIFDSVGKTVTGGRRTSRLTSYASIIEGQLRKDFDAMVRDKGVLMIRQNIVPVGTRTHRADEIVFFARGNFTSVRPPVHPVMVATSDTALVYYGHGAQVTPRIQAGLNNSYLYPATGPYAPASGNAQRTQPAPPYLGVGVNDKPEQWTLLRTATLLVKPQKDRNALSNGQGIPDNLRLVLDQLGLGTSPQEINRISDGTTQFALQPASPSIFRNVARATVESPYFASLDNRVRATQNLEGVPARSSGIVDIAMGDLDEVRQLIETGLVRPGLTGQTFGDIPSLANRVVRASSQPADFEFRPFGRFDLATIPPSGQSPPLPPAANHDSLDRMHVWMNDLFPAQSDGNGMYNQFANANGGLATERFARTRYEATPPGLLEVTDPQGDVQAYTADVPMMKSLLGDQIAIGSSTFLPRCTQFIVEWSFGQTYPTTDTNLGVSEGDLIWHGPVRDVSSSNPSWYRLLATPYPFRNGSGTPAQDWMWHRVAYPLQRNVNELRYYEVSDRLIYGYDANDPALPADNRWTLTSYFGYVDPTFNSSNPQRLQANRTRVWVVNGATGALQQASTTGADAADGNGDSDLGNDPTDAAVRNVPWAWPKLIRVTITLADPRQKDVEETFQYVFGVPELGQ